MKNLKDLARQALNSENIPTGNIYQAKDNSHGQVSLSEDVQNRAMEVLNKAGFDTKIVQEFGVDVIEFRLGQPIKSKIIKNAQQIKIETLQNTKAGLEWQLDLHENNKGALEGWDADQTGQELTDGIATIQSEIDRLEQEYEDSPEPGPEPEPKKRPCKIKWSDARYCEDESSGYMHDTDRQPVCRIQYSGQEATDPNQVTAYGLGYLEGMEVEAPTRDEAKVMFQTAFEAWLDQFYEIIPFSVAFTVTP